MLDQLNNLICYCYFEQSFAICIYSTLQLFQILILIGLKVSCYFLLTKRQLEHTIVCLLIQMLQMLLKQKDVTAFNSVAAIASLLALLNIT